MTYSPSEEQIAEAIFKVSKRTDNKNILYMAEPVKEVIVELVKMGVLEVKKT